jgi:hypothetical protein
MNPEENIMSIYLNPENSIDKKTLSYAQSVSNSIHEIDVLY